MNGMKGAGKRDRRSPFWKPSPVLIERDALAWRYSPVPSCSSRTNYTYIEYELHLMTNDEGRVKTAWQYIYGNGCTGK